ncbi:hypothetical protein EYF80_044349 [Liparis tanakae]|uniref:Uncharacterized protein n=1 Tax=Liparis tanakae TaxID=230148 RepID=A0A4Z2FY29_9TELE|nr:hypothetical protein EYF80_044349 [Liparis tanakae]
MSRLSCCFSSYVIWRASSPRSHAALGIAGVLKRHDRAVNGRLYVTTKSRSSPLKSALLAGDGSSTGTSGIFANLFSNTP